jgi:hypothetical protein
VLHAHLRRSENVTEHLGTPIKLNASKLLAEIRVRTAIWVGHSFD